MSIRAPCEVDAAGPAGGLAGVPPGAGVGVEIAGLAVLGVAGAWARTGAERARVSAARVIERVSGRMDYSSIKRASWSYAMSLGAAP
jgi:hypothetical protein